MHKKNMQLKQKKLTVVKEMMLRNMTLMEDIRDGIIGIQDGLIKGLAGLKDKGLLGLGILAGLVAAPFIAIAAFFKHKAEDVGMGRGQSLDKIMKGGL